MAIDLGLVAILLGVVRAPGVLLGFVLALILLRVTSRAAGGNLLGRTFRLAVRGIAAVILFVAAITLWGASEKAIKRMGADDRPAANATDTSAAPGSSAEINLELESLGLSATETLRLTANILALATADDSAEARVSADNVVAGIMDSDATDAQIAKLRAELVAAQDSSFQQEALRAAFAAALPAAAAADTAAIDSTAATGIASSDSAAAEPDSATRALEALNAELRTENAEMEEEVESLQRALEEERESGGRITGILRTAADDLGLGFGWAAVYFTCFLALWRGQTPGKRLVGLRVIRLNGKPMTWWIAFERFGGYTASLSTGLLGFVQIMWDRNRQGIHDKVAETVVVLTRDELPAVPHTEPPVQAA